jgi:hypothetical protein
MHKYTDFPELDAAQQRRLRCGGLDQVWVQPEPAANVAVAAE